MEEEIKQRFEHLETRIDQIALENRDFDIRLTKIEKEDEK